MRRSRVAAWLVLFLCSSCGKSCACGKSASDAKPAPTGTTTPSPMPPSAQNAPGSAGAGQAGGGASVREGNLVGADWEPAPPSQLTQRLSASKQAIETDRIYDQMTSDKALGGALHDQLGKLKATDKASSSVRNDDVTKLAVVARDYQAGNKSVRVKVTDTALMPEARHAVSARLALMGNAETGHEHGIFVHGSPALIAYLEDQHISKVTALVGDRLLVQVVVRGADKPDEAAHVLEQLDLSSATPKPSK